MNSFSELGVKKNIVDVLSNLKRKEPTDVQRKIIPMAMQGKNILFTSRTGSGKTLAFLLGKLNKIDSKRGLQMLVMVPTRELCIQVGKEIKQVCDPLDIKTGILYGGRKIAGDYRSVDKKNQIMVATPGRLIQHINAKRVRVGEVTYLVFDESDQMFDQGFYNECAYVKTRANKHVQVILASATISNFVSRFIEEHIPDYELIEIGSQIPEGIIQEKLYCKSREQSQLLIAFLKAKQFRKAIIFCNVKSQTESTAALLRLHKYKVRPLHGDIKQDERINTLNLFKQGALNILVTTDVAARGLQIEQVDIVINYEVARKPEFHVHRIGRTGRKDKKGYALTMISPPGKARFEEIMQRYPQQVVEIGKDFKPLK